MVRLWLRMKKRWVTHLYPQSQPNENEKPMYQFGLALWVPETIRHILSRFFVY